MENNTPPRRICLWVMEPAEKAIYDAIQEVEKMPADTRLTEAVILLGKAKERVADFIDGLEEGKASVPSNLKQKIEAEIAKFEKEYEETVPAASRGAILREILVLKKVLQMMGEERGTPEGPVNQKGE